MPENRRETGGIAARHVGSEGRAGRPSGYDEVIVEAICERIATSTDGLRKICADLAHAQPPIQLSCSMVYRWLSATDAQGEPVHPRFRDQYARAREAQCQVLADEVVELADGATEATVRRVALQIDVRKWQLAKLTPRKYGDHFDVKTDPTVTLVNDLPRSQRRMEVLGAVRARARLTAPESTTSGVFGAGAGRERKPTEESAGRRWAEPAERKKQPTERKKQRTRKARRAEPSSRPGAGK